MHVCIHTHIYVYCIRREEARTKSVYVPVIVIVIMHAKSISFTTELIYHRQTDRQADKHTDRK